MISVSAPPWVADTTPTSLSSPWVSGRPCTALCGAAPDRRCSAFRPLRAPYPFAAALPVGCLHADSLLPDADPHSESSPKTYLLPLTAAHSPPSVLPLRETGPRWNEIVSGSPAQVPPPPYRVPALGPSTLNGTLRPPLRACSTAESRKRVLVLPIHSIHSPPPPRMTPGSLPRMPLGCLTLSPGRPLSSSALPCLRSTGSPPTSKIAAVRATSSSAPTGSARLALLAL